MRWDSTSEKHDKSDINAAAVNYHEIHSPLDCMNVIIILPAQIPSGSVLLPSLPPLAITYFAVGGVKVVETVVVVDDTPGAFALSPRRVITSSRTTAP
jgi:hypothetical protein